MGISATNSFTHSLNEETTSDILLDLTWIRPTLTIDDYATINTPPTQEEIKKIVFYILSRKVASLDGYSSIFSQVEWPIIKQDFHRAITKFFITSPLSRKVKATTLILLLKADNVNQWEQFRIISLCTTLNKIITKIFTRGLFPM